MNPSSSQRGAVLISAIAVVAIMSGVAITTMGTMASSIKDALRREETRQARLLAIGVGHRVALRLIETHKSGVAYPVNSSQNFTFADGRASVTVRDGANCLNLNALFAPVESTNRRHAWLIVAALTDGRTDQVADLHNSRRDWTLFASLADVAATKTLDPDSLARLADHVCLRPDTEVRPLNLNTLGIDQADLLAAYTGHPEPGAARRLLQARPIGGFAVLHDALGDPFFSLSKDSSLIAITSPIHDIQVSVRYGDAVATLLTTIEHNGSTMRQLSRKFVHAP